MAVIIDPRGLSLHESVIHVLTVGATMSIAPLRSRLGRGSVMAKTRLRVVMGLAAAVALLSVGDDVAGYREVPNTVDTGAGEEPVEVDFFLPFLRSIAFYPVHIAEELGYFEDEGLSIASEATDGSSFVVQQVAADNAEFGIATADPVLLGFEQSPTFTSVYEFLTGNVFDLWVLDSSDVQQVADLDGRVVAVKDLAGGEIPGLNVLLQKNGIDPATDVDILPVGESAATAAEAMLNGRVDAFMVSWNSLVGVKQALEAEGESLRCLTCGAEDAQGSEVVIVANDFLENNPELVAGVGRALAKATLFAQTNPEAALEIMKTVNPEEQADPEFAEAYFDAALDITTPREPDNLYGLHSPEAWQNSMELLLAPDIPSGLSEEIDLEALIDNDFVEAYNDFDRDAVIQQAEEYTS
jgi:NitT/TauT family transport system substrate-binding protein